MAKTKNADPRKSRSSAVALHEEELDRVRGGGIDHFPAGTGGLDLATPRLKVKPIAKKSPDLPSIPDVDEW